MYKFILHGEKHNFRIEVDGPTEEELKTVDGPEIEGQTNDEEVILDRRLDELRYALKWGYSLKMLEE